MSATSVWTPSFTTYNWEDFKVDTYEKNFICSNYDSNNKLVSNFQPGFHPTALYKMENIQFCAKFNWGVCPATASCSRLCFNFYVVL